MATTALDPDMYTKQMLLTSTYHRDVYPALLSATSSAKDKIVLITGASKGLGRAVAPIWAAAGASGIIMCARSKESLAEVTSEISQANSETKVLALECDVTKSADVAALFNAAKQTFGTLDVVIANAGVANHQLLGHADEETWWSDFSINVRGAQLTAHHFVKTFGSDASGTFMIMASSIAAVTMPGFSCYSIAKLAGIRIAEFLDAECPNLRVFSVDPGIVRGVAKSPVFVPYACDTVELLGAFQIWAASGRADKCSGGYLHVTWDVEELERCGEMIKEKGLLKTSFLGGILGREGGALNELPR